MQLNLTEHEATFLLEQLGRHIAHVDNELVHTDKHELQHALSRDLRELTSIQKRLGALVQPKSA